MKTCLSDGLAEEVLKTSLSTLGREDPRTLLCVSFLWDYVEDQIYVPPLPANINDMNDRITAAINAMDRDIC